MTIINNYQIQNTPQNKTAKADGNYTFKPGDTTQNLASRLKDKFPFSFKTSQLEQVIKHLNSVDNQDFNPKAGDRITLPKTNEEVRNVLSLVKKDEIAASFTDPVAKDNLQVRLPDTQLEETWKSNLNITDLSVNEMISIKEKEDNFIDTYKNSKLLKWTNDVVDTAKNWDEHVFQGKLASAKAIKESLENFPSMNTRDTPLDAFRHVKWNQLMREKTTNTFTILAGLKIEVDAMAGWLKDKLTGEEPKQSLTGLLKSTQMDLNNNSVGRTGKGQTYWLRNK